MKKILIAIAALVVAGCSTTYAPNNNILLNTSGTSLLNTGSSNVTLTFTALGAGAAQTVTVNQPQATATDRYTAKPSSGCTGVASVAGTATATTSPGPTGQFTVTPVAIAPAGTCTITISSTSPGGQAMITVDTSGA